MGLRDRLSANYYIPLVAGTDSAARSGVLAPPEVYAPGLFPGGTGEPGGIGEGDGGNSTPDDLDISKPAITTPANGAVGVAVDVEAASSAFSSVTVGETHIKSRWVLEYRGADDSTNPSSYILYDSGPTADNLTTLPLVDIIGHGTRYAIKVRYKGSEGGWSPWSDYSIFTTVDCPDPGSTTAEEVDQHYEFTYDGAALTTHTETLDPPAEVLGWSNVKAYLLSATWDDRGSVSGTVTTVEPAYSGSAIVYSGPTVLISEGTGGLTLSTTNEVAGGCEGACNIRWTGDAAVTSLCDEFPPAPTDPPPPPPPIFVPPPAPAPWQPPETPGTEPPPVQPSFPCVSLDMTTSRVFGEDGDGAAQTKTFANIVKDGGFDLQANTARIVVALNNACNDTQQVNVGITTDSASFRLSADTGTAGPVFSINNGSEATTGYGGFGEHPLEPGTMGATLNIMPHMGYSFTVMALLPEAAVGGETHTFTIDIGVGDPVALKLSFGNAPSGGFSPF